MSTTLNGNPKTLASSVSYLPYGDITGLTYGNTLPLSHGYDNQYRTSSIAVGSVLDRIYNYDANGNITWIDDGDQPGNEASENAGAYSYQQATNKLTQVQGELNVVYGYDANGNITSANSRTFTYDLSNRLSKVEDNSVTIGEYVYNGLNQRIKKILPGGTRIFHYGLQGQLIAETTPSGQTLVEYFYLGDYPLAMIRPTELLYYYHNDHLGTPQILTNDSGTVSWKAVYSPFGEAEILIGTVENPLRFPGQYYDQETGLHYNWNRYYDPKTGRYLTPDPVGLEGGINLFLYANGNPLVYYDSSGMFTVCRLVSIGKKRVSIYTRKGSPSSGYPRGHGCIAVDISVYKLQWKVWNQDRIKKRGGCIWNEFWIEGYGQGYARDTGDDNIKGPDRLDAYFETEEEGKAFERKVNHYPMVTVFECEEIPCCTTK